MIKEPKIKKALMSIMKYINYINGISQDIRRKPLNTIERDIIDLLYQGKTYLEIASQSKYDDGYIGDIARELYGLIGQKHKTKITRSNLFAVLDSVMGGELDDSFYYCHGIKSKNIFNPGILEFNQSGIIINLSSFWKLDAKNNSLILKTKAPIVLRLGEIDNSNLGATILNLARQQQLSGDALLELCKILDSYLTKQMT